MRNILPYQEFNVENKRIKEISKIFNDISESDNGMLYYVDIDKPINIDKYKWFSRIIRFAPLNDTTYINIQLKENKNDIWCHNLLLDSFIKDEQIYNAIKEKFSFYMEGDSMGFFDLKKD